MFDPFDEDRGDDPGGEDRLASLNASVARMSDLIESRIAPALERIAAALEARPIGGASPTGLAASIAGFREAMRNGDLAGAGRLLEELRSDHPEAPEADRLGGDLAAARRVAVEDKRRRLDAARTAGDAEAALTFRDELAELMEAAERIDLDRDLGRWVMTLLMKRLRHGTVGPDVAHLAARVSNSLGHLPEGASLRASLPTLRRSAGLCPRCAGPYTGVEDACPKCQAETPRIAEVAEMSPEPSRET